MQKVPAHRHREGQPQLAPFPSSSPRVHGGEPRRAACGRGVLVFVLTDVRVLKGSPRGRPPRGGDGGLEGLEEGL